MSNDFQVVIEEGELSKGNKYQIIVYKDKFYLEVNGAAFNDSISITKIKMIVESIKYYEVFRNN